MIKFIKYRESGNCFVNCVVQACKNLKDPKIINSHKPELSIFIKKTLVSDNLAGELKSALKYLLKKEYQVKIIDPEPNKNNNWGKNNLSKVIIEKRRYFKNDINRLITNNWQVVISSELNDIPHAILFTKEKLYDPQNKETWSNPKNLADIHFKKYMSNNQDRFLIAINNKDNAKEIK